MKKDNIFTEKCICQWSKDDEYGFIPNTKCKVHGKKARKFLSKCVKIKMKKKITIEMESEEENERIKTYLVSWLRDNFRFGESATIKIEDVE